MSSTLSITNSLNAQEEALFKGVRRSRFSFHLNTRRVRRWLLIQMVSVPVSATAEEGEAPVARQARKSYAPTQTPAQLLSAFETGRLYSRWG
ncbi:MAG: hypothetical protein QOH93_59 [Chloroflexia bacterium]|jgi:hypothetical protein|nr:hypothetical protein [Chloroflexia bacterium]